MPSKKQVIERVHCSKCLHRTKHLVLVRRSNGGSAPVDENDPFCEIEISWSTIYTLLECCGCENVVLRRNFYFSEWGPGEYEEEYYPPLISRQLPRWYEKLPDHWQEMLKEIYTALHADSRCLALLGTRTLIDLYLNKEVGDIGGFKERIKDLERKGMISKTNRNFLEVALEAGHAAAHRGHKPKIDEINQVIDIVENLLHGYLLKKEAKVLKTKIPTRNKKKM